MGFAEVSCSVAAAAVVVVMALSVADDGVEMQVGAMVVEAVVVVVVVVFVVGVVGLAGSS